MNNDLISSKNLIELFEDCAGECACCIHNTNDFKYCGLLDEVPQTDKGSWLTKDALTEKIKKDISNSEGEVAAIAAHPIYREPLIEFADDLIIYLSADLPVNDIHFISPKGVTKFKHDHAGKYTRLFKKGGEEE